MCCFSGFLLVGLDVGRVSKLKINYVQMEATLHCCFSMGGLKLHRLKKQWQKQGILHIYTILHTKLCTKIF